MNKQDLAADLAAVRVRLDELSALPAVANQLAEMRATMARADHQRHLADVRARADHQEIAALNPSDRSEILNGMSAPVRWALASPEGMDPVTTWAPSLPSSARDELECRASILPRRVRVGSLPRSVQFYPRAHQITSDAQYKALVACGMGASIVEINGAWALASVGFDQVRIYPIEAYLAIAAVDADLARFAADGSITVAEVSDEENVQFQIGAWRTVAAHDRPSFPRRKREPSTTPNTQTPEAT